MPSCLPALKAHSSSKSFQRISTPTTLAETVEEFSIQNQFTSKNLEFLLTVWVDQFLKVWSKTIHGVESTYLATFIEKGCDLNGNFTQEIAVNNQLYNHHRYRRTHRPVHYGRNFKIFSKKCEAFLHCIV